ncbi:MAG: phosphatidylglycerol lysyltransferase domain-containing protein [Tepidisphaeraceae bacterium]
MRRERVMRHGRLSSAYQILNPDFDYWFDESLDAVAGYVRRGDWWVVGGGPVCADENEAAAGRAIEAAAARQGCRVVFVCADDRLKSILLSQGHHGFVTIGAETVWNPQYWWHRPRQSASLRQQLNRARNKHVRVSPLFGDAIAAVAGELRPVVADWLTTRPLPAMRFLNDPRSLDGELAGRRAWVARQDGRVVAFLLASPVVQRNGYLFELIARRHDAPNGTVELLIDAAMRGVAESGSTYATLGLVILSPYAVDAMRKNPLWMRALTEFSRARPALL